MQVWYIQATPVNHPPHPTHLTYLYLHRGSTNPTYSTTYLYMFEIGLLSSVIPEPAEYRCKVHVLVTTGGGAVSPHPLCVE